MMTSPRRATGSSRRLNLVAVAWLAFLGGVFLPGTESALSAPHVTGYERFHGGTPGVAGGAILYSELGCASCHGGGEAVVPRRGATLTDLRSRVDRDWVREFLVSPEKGRAGSTMPSLAHDLTGPEVEAVLAYLGSLGKGISLRKERHANAERGSALYHEKGCIACHEPTKDYRGPRARGDRFDSALAVAHPELKEKTSLAALHHFLMQPSAFRPDGRMPHFALEKQEAMDIAAHLMDFQASDPREAASLSPWPEPREGEVALGRQLVGRRNCAACHTLPGIEPAAVSPLAGAVEGRGCLSGEKKAGVPFYSLTEAQRESLVLFLGTDGEVAQDELTFAAMNCLACHERDGEGGPTSATDPYFVGAESLGDSGRLPPPLTGVGHKLLPRSMQQVFSGLNDSRIRPYLKTGMPVYGQHAVALTDWLQKLDEKTVAHRAPGGEDLSPDLVAAGRKLLGVHGGVNCITCHNWGERKSLGIPALDISNLDRRLRYDWFHEYLLNPSSYRPGTLMPPLWPGGQSTVPDVLGGNAQRQIEAVWAFIAAGEGVPEGFPDRTGGRFELVPEDRPIIQRTFLNRTGTKAILVGFPGSVHLAYDGEKGRPSLLWRGAFFDAYDTWFTRAAPFGDPLSDEVYPFEGEKEERRFLGYELDPEGNPTFLLRDGEREIGEQFKVEGDVMVRTLRWGQGDEPVVGHPEGVERSLERKQGVIEIRYEWK